MIIGNAQLVEILLAAGADMNLQDRKGRTPAHLCAIHHCRDVLYALGKADIEADAPPAAKQSTGGQRLNTEVRDYDGMGWTRDGQILKPF